MGRRPIQESCVRFFVAYLDQKFKNNLGDFLKPLISNSRHKTGMGLMPLHRRLSHSQVQIFISLTGDRLPFDSTCRGRSTTSSPHLMLSTIILLRFTPLASPLLRAGFSIWHNNHLLFFLKFARIS